MITLEKVQGTSAVGPFLLSLKGWTWRMSHLELRNATIAKETGDRAQRRWGFETRTPGS